MSDGTEVLNNLENEFEKVSDIPETGSSFENLMNFATQPTLQDGKETKVETDFLNNAENKTENNLSGNNQNLNNPALPTQKKVIDRGAKAVIKGIDFLHGLLNGWLGKLTEQEKEQRKFRVSKSELDEFTEALSEEFIATNTKIPPKAILFLLFSGVMIEKSYDAYNYGKNKSKFVYNYPDEQTQPKERIKREKVEKSMYFKNGKPKKGAGK